MNRAGFRPCACDEEGPCQSHDQHTVEMVDLLQKIWLRWRSGLPVAFSADAQERMVEITGWVGESGPAR